MTDTWRPANWQNPYAKGRYLNSEEIDKLHEIYEAGAEAMLEVMKVRRRRNARNKDAGKMPKV